MDELKESPSTSVFGPSLGVGTPIARDNVDIILDVFESDAFLVSSCVPQSFGDGASPVQLTARHLTKIAVLALRYRSPLAVALHPRWM